MITDLLSFKSSFSLNHEVIAVCGLLDFFAALAFIDYDAASVHRADPGIENLFALLARTIDRNRAARVHGFRFEENVLALRIGINRCEHLILFDADVSQLKLFCGNSRGQTSGPNTDDRHVNPGFWLRAGAVVEFARDVFDYVCSFIGRVLNQRRAGDIANDVTAWDVGHERRIAHRNRARLDLLRRVDDDAGLWIDWTLDLTGSVFHTLIARDRRGDPVDDREHIVWAGINTGMAANAALGKNYRMRIIRRVRVKPRQVLGGDQRHTISVDCWRRHGLFQQTASPFCVADGKPETRNHQKDTNAGPAIPRQTAKITLRFIF